jgi:hypothetical protein
MKRTLQNIVLGTALTAAALGIGGCYSAKNDIYSRIDNSTNLSYENRQTIKDSYRTLNIKETEKILGINHKDVEKMTKEQRKQMAIEFNRNIADANIIDPKNVSDKDVVFMCSGAYAVAVGALIENQ